jgi:hypothetical protein
LDAAGTVLRTAKCHFSDDGTEVPEDQNIIWLKEEMRRSAIAALFAKKFVEMAKAKGVSIHGAFVFHASTLREFILSRYSIPQTCHSSRGHVSLL